MVVTRTGKALYKVSPCPPVPRASQHRDDPGVRVDRQPLAALEIGQAGVARRDVDDRSRGRARDRDTGDESGIHRRVAGPAEKSSGANRRGNR